MKLWQKHGIHLEKFPNIHLLDCQFKAITHFSGAVHLYYIGGVGVRKSNYFTTNELSVIICAMNIAQSALTSFRSQNFLRESRYLVRKLPHFEMPGTLPQNVAFKRKACSEVLSHHNMVRFASAFKDALKFLATEDYEESILSHLLGVNFHHTLVQFQLEKFRKFAGELRYNYFVTFSIAGIKNHFHSQPAKFILKSVKLDKPEDVELSVQTKIFTLMKYLKDNVFETTGDFKKYVYNVDIGVEMVPLSSQMSFLLKGFSAKDVLEDQLRE